MLRFATYVLALCALALLASCGDNDAAPSSEATKPLTTAEGSKPASPAGGGDSHAAGDSDDEEAHRDDDHQSGEADHAEGEKGHGHGEEREALKLSDAELKTAGVRVAEVKVQAVADQISVPATVQADQSRMAHVAPKVSGRIVRIHVRLGDSVQRGQVLATIDSIEVGEAQAAYVDSRAQLDLAQSSFERARQLFEEQIIPQKDWLQAQADLEKARAAERAAAGRLRLLGVSRPTGQGDPSSVYTLVAPFAGTVTELENAVQGELAKPEEGLFTVADLSRVWVQASLPEADLPRVRVGAPAAIEVAAYPGERFEGRVAYVSSGLDRETRTVQARIEVPNPKGRLKMEMFATAHIEAGAGEEQALVVPREAVVLMDGKPAVFVREDGGFEARGVELGQPLARGTVVRSGVRPGEQVVVAGAYALKARVLKSQMGEGHAH
jgi:cobalt-zinc-cadmium efflux system membrane fusion protein